MESCSVLYASEILNRILIFDCNVVLGTKGELGNGTVHYVSERPEEPVLLDGEISLVEPWRG